MDRSQATFEAYDGVELRLLNERVVQCPPLTVAEAVRYLRMLSRVSEDFGAHYAFMAEFPERIGIAEIPLGDLGFVMPSPVAGAPDLDGNGLTVTASLALLEVLAKAEQGDQDAIADFFDRFPPAIGVEPADLSPPAQVFECGRVFAEHAYTLIYGLASDFLTHLTTSPRGQVMMIARAGTTTPAAPTKSKQALTT